MFHQPYNPVRLLGSIPIPRWFCSRRGRATVPAALFKLRGTGPCVPFFAKCSFCLPTFRCCRSRFGPAGFSRPGSVAGASVGDSFAACVPALPGNPMARIAAHKPHTSKEERRAVVRGLPIIRPQAVLNPSGTPGGCWYRPDSLRPTGRPFSNQPESLERLAVCRVGKNGILETPERGGSAHPLSPAGHAAGAGIHLVDFPAKLRDRVSLPNEQVRAAGRLALVRPLARAWEYGASRFFCQYASVACCCGQIPYSAGVRTGAGRVFSGSSPRLLRGGPCGRAVVGLFNTIPGRIFNIPGIDLGHGWASPFAPWITDWRTLSDRGDFSR